MRFESYHGNFGLFLTVSEDLDVFFAHVLLSLTVLKEHFFQNSSFCVPQKKDHTDFERHECEKIMTGYLLLM